MDSTLHRPPAAGLPRPSADGRGVPAAADPPPRGWLPPDEPPAGRRCCRCTPYSPRRRGANPRATAWGPVHLRDGTTGWYPVCALHRRAMQVAYDMAERRYHRLPASPQTIPPIARLFPEQGDGSP